MVTSTIVIAIPGLAPTDTGSDPLIKSANDMDYDYSQNYMEAERERFCGTGQPPGSTDYIQEFAIPTTCTGPHAITTDYDGNPWFAQSNAGRVAMFDVDSETFTEYPNPHWPIGSNSMMWGIDYAPDGLVWFTDDLSDSVWVLNPINEQYGRIQYPKAVSDPLPQRLEVAGSQIIVNDFYGNMLTFLDPNNSEMILVAPSPIDDSVTSGFAVDPSGHIWYTTWSYPNGGGYLVMFDYARYVSVAANTGQMCLPPIDYVTLYELPSNIQTPNGIALSESGTVLIADTSSSYFFEFNPLIRHYTQYVTADPMPSAYGNKTGVIKSPISRPYWMATDDAGRIVFNSQTSNNISVFDPARQTLVEYQVPSKNPYWTDCGMGAEITSDNSSSMPDLKSGDNCGIAQVFDFDIYQDKIWFTEWVENKIGVVDMSVPLPFEIAESQPFVASSPGSTVFVSFDVVGTDGAAPGSDDDDAAAAAIGEQFVPYAIPAGDHLSAVVSGNDNNSTNFDVAISVSADAPSGIYKVLLGAQAPDISVAKFVTVTVQ